MYQLVFTDQEFELVKRCIMCCNDGIGISDDEMSTYNHINEMLIDAQDHKNEREYHLRKLMNGNDNMF